MSLKIRLLCAVLCALLAMYTSFSYAQSVRSDAQKVRDDAIASYGGDVVRLVVTTHPLQIGDTIKAEDIVVRDWVSDLAPKDAYLNSDDVIGKEVKVAVGENVPLSTMHFTESDDELVIPNGRVALSLPMNERLGIGLHITPRTQVLGYDTTNKTTHLITKDMIALCVKEAQPAQNIPAQLVLAVYPTDVTHVLSAAATQSLRLVIPAQDVQDLKDDSQQVESEHTKEISSNSAIRRDDSPKEKDHAQKSSESGLKKNNTASSAHVTDESKHT